MSVANHQFYKILRRNEAPLFITQRTLAQFKMLYRQGFLKSRLKTLQSLLNNSKAINISSLNTQFGAIGVTQILEHKNHDWYFIMGREDNDWEETILGIERRNGSNAYREWNLIFEMADGVEKITDIILKQPSLSLPPQKNGGKEKENGEDDEGDEDYSSLIFFHDAMVRIDSHAIERFVQRSPEFKINNGIKNPIKKLKKIFLGSVPDNSITSTHRVRRFLSNKFIEAEYWRNDTWRFVVLKKDPQYPERKLLKTVERIF